MSNRKFFSGLPAGMMEKQQCSTDRQQTHFYWPDETDVEDDQKEARKRLRNRSMSAASLISQSQASTDTEESRRRRNQHNKSTIEFYDMIDTGLGTDAESVCSKVNDSNRRRKQETLQYRIGFHDFAEKKAPQRDDDVLSVIERPVKGNSETFGGSAMTSENIQKVENEITKSFQNLSMTQNGQSSNVSHSNIFPEKSSGTFQSRVNRAQNHAELNSSFYPEAQNPYKLHTPYQPNSPPRRKPSQYDSFSESDGEERFQRSQERNYLPPRYPPSQTRSIRPQPRRHNSEFFDFDDDGYDRQYDTSNRRPRYRKPDNVPRMVRRRDHSPEFSDEEFYEFSDGYRRSPKVPERYRSNGRLDDTESYFRGRNNRKAPSMNGYGSEMEHQRPPVRRASPKNYQQSPPANVYNSEMNPQPTTAARPPIKPLSRTMSINEAKQRYHTNLRSNIFHTDPDYNVLAEHRKPASVREAAGTQRVGVGLPDIFVPNGSN